jgi:CspA family cold shock protein
MRSGTVSSFDEASGLGEITESDGTVRPFHCVEIADGTRSIAAGTRVDFELLAKLGRWEAARIRPTGRSLR